MFRELCGDAALKNAVLVTNMWGEVARDIGEARENELSGKCFKPALDKDAQLVRHHNTVQSAHSIIRRIVANNPVVLRIQRELVDEHKDITGTAAGEAVNRELHKQIGRHQAELKAVQEEMERASKEEDEETRQELEEEKRKLEEQKEKIKRNLERIAFNYAVEKERMEVKMKEMEQEAEKERKRAEAEYHRRLTDPNPLSLCLPRPRMRCLKMFKKSRQRSQQPASLGIPTYIPAGPLGFDMTLDPDVPPQGALRSIEIQPMGLIWPWQQA